MPNRMLRDVTDSDRVNVLSSNAEVLFYRLMMKADDYGSFFGNPKLIKANCYPLKLDTVRDADISRWTDELLKAGLIAVYTHAGKEYLRIINFGQRLRNKKKKFPDCPPELLRIDSDPPQHAASRGNPPPEVEENTEAEKEDEEEQRHAEKIFKDGRYYEFLRMNWKLADDQIRKMLTDFEMTLAANTRDHLEYGDYKSHFHNWAASRWTTYSTTGKGAMVH